MQVAQQEADRCKWRNRKFSYCVARCDGSDTPTGSSGTGTTGSTGLESTGASELVVESEINGQPEATEYERVDEPKEEVTQASPLWI